MEAEVAALHRIVAQLGPKDTIEAILNGLAPLFLGYKDAAATKNPVSNELIVPPGQPIDGVERGVWFPDIEFDESMESSDRWPTPGTISGQPQGTMMPQHTITNGGVSRTDGQAMFETGSTSPRPEPGVE